MTLDRKTVFALVAAFAVGWWFSSSGYAPGPTPANDRPVLRWIGRAARSLLWISLIAEEPPAQPEARHLVHAPPVGEDGYQRIDHGEGW